MKKKLISIILCAVTVLSLAGCGSTKTKESAKDDTATVSNSNSTDDKKETKEEAKKEEKKVLCDNEFAKITYTGIDRDGLMGPEINLEIENKTKQAITIQSRDVSVDGYMTDPIFSVDIEQGKKAKDKLTLMKQDIDKDFKSIEGKFKIMPKDDFVNTLKDEPFTIKY